MRRLDLREFRTYERLALELPEGMTFLTGSNGIGKTNLLEAVAMSLLGASPRTSAEARCVRHGAAALRLQAEVDVAAVPHQLVVTYQNGHGKRLAADGNERLTTEEFSSVAPCSVFLPERLLVVRGAPARRRATLDRLVTRIDRAAAASMRSYVRALTQRNVLLRRGRQTGHPPQELQTWTDLVAHHGAQVRVLRAQAIEELNPRFVIRFEQLTGLDAATVSLALRGTDLPVDLAAQLSIDLRRGSTTVGPHLDDVDLRVAGRDLRHFGSTGEQRAALLAWTLAEADVLSNLAGVTPVVLLDEPYAELDADRCERLHAVLLSLGQVIVTSTSIPERAESLSAVGELSSERGTVSLWSG